MDQNCNGYKTNSTIIRNEVSYIEFKVITPEYQSFYPVHKSLKLDGKEFLPENLEEIQSWS